MSLLGAPIDVVYADNFTLSGRSKEYTDMRVQDIDMFFNNNWNNVMSDRQNIELIQPYSDEEVAVIKKTKKVKKKKNYKPKVTYHKDEYTEHFTSLADETEDKCARILRHIKTCKKCRQMVLDTYDSPTDEIMDLVIYAITGAFVLFLLDLFFRKGLMSVVK